MIKESIIFEGTVGDDINDIIPNVINRRNKLNKDVFIRWNGATIRVEEKDDKNSILKKYYDELVKVDLYNKHQNNELISKNELANKISSIIIKYLNNNQL